MFINQHQTSAKECKRKLVGSDFLMRIYHYFTIFGNLEPRGTERFEITQSPHWR